MAIEWLRINNDTNGNPRYVCGHSVFLLPTDDPMYGQTVGGISARYALALSRARKLGGRKFHNKQYGGGIVFQSYNLQTLEKDISALLAAN